MALPSIFTLSAVLFVSELSLALSKRTNASGKDHFTLPILWLVIGLSIWAAFYLRDAFPQGTVTHRRAVYLLGLTLFLIGLIVRWGAILYLGRLFTVNVAIAQDHELVTTGPYRHIRHPSYSGALLIFLGYGLCFLNFASLAALFIPITIAFLWRIHVEEAALEKAFGDRYRQYAASTGRLIPRLF